MKLTKRKFWFENPDCIVVCKEGDETGGMRYYKDRNPHKTGITASKIKITIPTILAIKQRIDAGENSAVVCASYGVKKDSFWHALRRSKKRGVL